MGRPKKPKQPPAPKYRLIGDDTKDGKEIRGLIKGLLKTVATFKELAPAKIAIAWISTPKGDSLTLHADGRTESTKGGRATA